MTSLICYLVASDARIAVRVLPDVSGEFAVPFGALLRWR
jgi:hypothetical protein